MDERTVKDYYTVAEVAELLGISKSCVRYKIAAIPQNLLQKDADGTIKITAEGVQHIQQLPRRKPRSNTTARTARTLSAQDFLQRDNCAQYAAADGGETVAEMLRLQREQIDSLQRQIDALMRQNEVLADALKAQTVAVAQLTEGRKRRGLLRLFGKTE